jgi:hypothetical protein
VSLDDVLYIEVVALMVVGVLARRPCRYVTHIPWVWFNDCGRAIRGICHPQVPEGLQ